jgi:hypothetical protein
MNEADMTQYAIMVRPEGADRGAEIELCRVKSNPESIVAAALKKTRVFKDAGGTKIVQIYEHAYFKEVSK